MASRVPQTKQEYVGLGLLRRVWLGTRPYALKHAAGVDADVNAALRNHYQISRTILISLGLTIPLVGVNSRLLHHQFDLTTAWSAFALVMAQVGAFFALKRSNETRAYLGEVRMVLHEVTARSVLASAISYPRELASIGTSEDLTNRATDVLRHLMDSRLFPRSIDAFSVWARDDKQGVWRMVAAVGTSEKSVQTFFQKILVEETPGAGIVANLAVTADQGASYYQARSSEGTDWYAADPEASRKTETLAAFILPDPSGIPIGAFALTSAKEDALEAAADGLPERTKLIIDQCTLTLVGVARRAHELWTEGR